MTDIICQSCGSERLHMELEFGMVGTARLYAECEGCGEAGIVDPNKGFVGHNND